MTVVNGVEYVESGGSDELSFVNSFGVEVVNDGGVSDDAVIFVGGTEDIFSGGFASATTIYGSGYTAAGGANSSTSVGSGGVQYVYDNSYQGCLVLD